jgi:hypothetical protein
MDIRELVRALLAFDALTARQWVADAVRTSVQWHRLMKPEGLDSTELALAAGLAEVLAARAGQLAPPWTADVPAASVAMYLVRAAHSMPRLRRLCEAEGPEPLRRRGLYAPPDFLTFA